MTDGPGPGDDEQQESGGLRERIMTNDANEIRGVGVVSEALAVVGAYALFAPIAVIGAATTKTSKIGAEILGTLLPSSDAAWRRVAIWSLNQMHKNSGGDAVGLVINEDMSLDIQPAKLKRGTLDDDDVEEPGWHLRDRDRVWAETADGRDLARAGKAPVAFLPASSTRRVSPIEAEVKAAIDNDRWQHVLSVDQPSAVEMDVTLDAAAANAAQNGEAVADGGVDARVRNVKRAVLDDTLVDISNDERVSFQKVVDQYRAQSDVERMDEQQRLGFQAGRVDADERDVQGFVIKVMLLALGIVAAALIGPDLLSQAGSAASGSGGVVPFMLGLGGL